LSNDNIIRSKAFFGALTLQQSMLSEGDSMELVWIEKAKSNLNMALESSIKIENKKNGVLAYVNFLMAKVMLKKNNYDSATKHLEVAKSALRNVDYEVLFKFRLQSLTDMITAAREAAE